MSGPGGFQPSFHITHRMTAGLTRIERVRGFLEAARLSEDWLATMRSRAFLLEAHHTTHIEGTRLTLEQAERLLAGEAVAGTNPDDVRELLNYRDAFEFVSGYLNDGGPVTEGLIVCFRPACVQLDFPWPTVILIPERQPMTWRPLCRLTPFYTPNTNSTS